MLKWIARKILHDEIERLEESKEALRNGNIELCEIIKEAKKQTIRFAKTNF